MQRVRQAGGHRIDVIDLAPMIADHADLGQLCDELEHVADALPSPLAGRGVLRLCERLERAPAEYEARESALLAAVFEPVRNGSLQAAALDHIRVRCASHVVQAQDLATVLRSGGAPLTVDTLGYMLRCFFEGCRIDMAFEELTILQLAGTRLTPPARNLLTSSLKIRCRL